ncbi:hypothetical protein BGZ61DRAFT_487040 [Ilyonectria robusta]|uniref:uncharacterized protein n=1 Tax=Ilyonectria robusta TaxID=1079257 RepID=UPI001E8D56AA|nr:uncharacterized protein BGZ61DRAFT_487040 [Ilyonectria robusta]KAH8654395.1 hypothetical protein BGZ61DRAFT_487040 [Ilyonectria robusta]
MPTQAAQNIMLAITVMPRLVKPLPYKTKIANAFFILRGVVLVLHQQDAFDKPGDFLSRMAHRQMSELVRSAPKIQSRDIVALPLRKRDVGSICFWNWWHTDRLWRLVDDIFPRNRHNPVFWWLGPRGKILGCRSVPGSTTGSEHWIDIRSEASLPAGRLTFTILSQPVQMAIVWEYEPKCADNAGLGWVNFEGDLMATYASLTSAAHEGRTSKTVMDYCSIKAPPCTALAAQIRNEEDIPIVYVH